MTSYISHKSFFCIYLMPNITYSISHIRYNTSTTFFNRLHQRSISDNFVDSMLTHLETFYNKSIFNQICSSISNKRIFTIESIIKHRISIFYINRIFAKFYSLRTISVIISKVYFKESKDTRILSILLNPKNFLSRRHFTPLFNISLCRFIKTLRFKVYITRSVKAINSTYFSLFTFTFFFFSRIVFMRKFNIKSISFSVKYYRMFNKWNFRINFSKNIFLVICILLFRYSRTKA